MLSAVSQAIEAKLGTDLGAEYAKVQQCKCGAKTIVGLDERVMALNVRLDLEPIDADGELTEVCARRRTYTLEPVVTKAGRRWHIYRRDPWRMANRPPWPDQAWTVHRRHVCHA